MKVIGLVGGMSWESTVPYYREINESIRYALGGLHSARLVLYSVDFHDVEQLQHAGDWDTAGELVADAARAVERAGADFIVLCSNTMHKIASTVEAAVKIPLLHIADPTAETVRSAGGKTVGLLATRFTMEQEFYVDRLRNHGLQVVLPRERDRELIHRVIYEELCLGRIVDSSRDEYRRIIADLVGRGADSVILGCTEITLLIDESDSPVPLYDTTRIHARKAAEWSLAAP